MVEEMYETFYGLRAKPFAVVPDPRFIYWAGAHSMAFSMLEYGIVNHAGFTVITGEIGAGKTTLLRHLLSQVPGGIDIGPHVEAWGELLCTAVGLEPVPDGVTAIPSRRGQRGPGR